MRTIIALLAAALLFGCLEDEDSHATSEGALYNCKLEAELHEPSFTDCHWECPGLPFTVSYFGPRGATCPDSVCIDVVPGGGWDWCDGEEPL